MKKSTLMVLGVVLGANSLIQASEASTHAERVESFFRLVDRCSERAIVKLQGLLNEDSELVHARGSVELASRGFGEEGWTALHMAMIRCSPVAVEFLVRNGADVNARINDEDDTEPLNLFDTKFTPLDWGKMKECRLYLACAGGRFSDCRESYFKRTWKQSLRATQQEYRERLQALVEEKTGLPKVIAELILDFEKGKEGKTQRVATDDADFEKGKKS